MFIDETRVTTYGDDGVISVSDAYRDIYNAETVIAFLLKSGIRVTAADKTDIVEPYTTLDQITFLKRKFVPHPYRVGQYLAPLPQLSIEEAVKWIHKGEDKTLATLENCEQSIRMAYGSGSEYFNEWKGKVNTALRNCGLKTFDLTWEELDINFFGDIPPRKLNLKFERGVSYTLC
ncbi:hypothetical protein [Corynebacterium parakroppenstedtii]|uniref:hypothetical protein n=1 Tax=Corynebacterium parakroppenstedtii TaxID=2828363 RepID=UPI0030EB3053